MQPAVTTALFKSDHIPSHYLMSPSSSITYSFNSLCLRCQFSRYMSALGWPHSLVVCISFFSFLNKRRVRWTAFFFTDLILRTLDFVLRMLSLSLSVLNPWTNRLLSINCFLISLELSIDMVSVLLETITWDTVLGAICWTAFIRAFRFAWICRFQPSVVVFSYPPVQWKSYK